MHLNNAVGRREVGPGGVRGLRAGGELRHERCRVSRAVVDGFEHVVHAKHHLLGAAAVPEAAVGRVLDALVAEREGAEVGACQCVGMRFVAHVLGAALLGNVDSLDLVDRSRAGGNRLHLVGMGATGQRADHLHLVDVLARDRHSLLLVHVRGVRGDRLDLRHHNLGVRGDRLDLILPSRHERCNRLHLIGHLHGRSHVLDLIDYRHVREDALPLVGHTELLLGVGLRRARDHATAGRAAAVHARARGLIDGLDELSRGRYRIHEIYRVHVAIAVRGGGAGAAPGDSDVVDAGHGLNRVLQLRVKRVPLDAGRVDAGTELELVGARGRDG